MTKTLSWRSLLKQGETWAHVAPIPPHALLEFTNSLPKGKQIAVRVIKGRECLTKGALLKEFARALDFPDYFGNNWDALEDCLNDLEWLSAEAYVFFIDHADAMLPGDEASLSTLVGILKGASDAFRSAEYQIPFSIVFQCEPRHGEALVNRLERAGCRTQ